MRTKTQHILPNANQLNGLGQSHHKSIPLNLRLKMICFTRNYLRVFFCWLINSRVQSVILWNRNTWTIFFAKIVLFLFSLMSFFPFLLFSALSFLSHWETKTGTNTFDFDVDCEESSQMRNKTAKKGNKLTLSLSVAKPGSTRDLKPWATKPDSYLYSSSSSRHLAIKINPDNSKLKWSNSMESEKIWKKGG